MALVKFNKILCSEDWNSFDLDPDILSQFDPIVSMEIELANLKKGSSCLREIKIEYILTFFQSLREKWISEGNVLMDKFPNLGLSYFFEFFKASNLSALIESSLRGDINCLDRFVAIPGSSKKVMALPIGVITHWTAGNIPGLGIISLLQGILTRNINIVKLPLKNGLILPLFIEKIRKHTININGEKISGSELLNPILFLYCEKDDLESQKVLSLLSDVRIIWGGSELVQSINRLERKPYSGDLVFGPKYSFMVLGKHKLKITFLDDIADRAALDISLFDQEACTSPHTIFVEEGGEATPIEFAESLSQSMENKLKRFPKGGISAETAFKIANIRAENLFSGKIFNSSGTEWTIIYSEEEGMADPVHSRVIFVKPIKNIDDILEYVQPCHQTVGLEIDEKRKENFSIKLAIRGISRITGIGTMSLFDHPWDGLFPLDRMVRWVSM